MNRILLVEDHERLGRLIREGLSQAGIAADVVGHIDAAWVALRQVDYGALVLDRGLPDGDGLALLQRLRSEGNGIACLVLTARDALGDRVKGLEAGADDYLPKPFAMDEMVARVRALLRRPAQQRSLDPASGDLRLHPQAGTVQCRDDTVTLAMAEMQIMLLLVQANGNMVRRAALEAAGWGLSDAVTPNALNVVLHRLRRKLSAIGSCQRIVNVKSLGYALQDANAAQ
ncbi:response regulator transcription factor [Roseateles sp. P5_E11]